MKHPHFREHERGQAIVIMALAMIVLLAFAFHQTGGIENPFLLFFMLPLTLAAYALSWPRLLGSVPTSWARPNSRH